MFNTFNGGIKIMETRTTPASDVWLTLRSMEGVYSELLEESSKLESYMTGGAHPSADFWREVQYLDPRKASMIVGTDTEVVPSSLQNLLATKVPKLEIVNYKTYRESLTYDQSFFPLRFWRTYSREMPTLSTLAIVALSIPASSADVERSFSLLKRLLTPDRNAFTEDNLEIHMKLQFNKEPDSSIFNVSQAQLYASDEDDFDD